MSLADDILALSPSLYWKLDDPTGPAASDSSGNGHHGVYGGAFSLGQYGPEPDTFAAQFATGGSALCTGFPQLGTAPFTCVWYASRNSAPTPVGGDEIVHGNRGAARGWFFSVTATDFGYTTSWRTSGASITVGQVAIPVWNKWWHAYAVRYDGAGQYFNYYDGNMIQQSATGLAAKSILSTDDFGVMGVHGLVVAHLAFFDKTLTDPQIANLHSYRFSWPFGPMINTVFSGTGGGSADLSPTDPIVIQINEDLELIRKSVRREYPPLEP